MISYNDEKYDELTNARELIEEIFNILEMYDEAELSSKAYYLMEVIDERLKELEVEHDGIESDE